MSSILKALKKLEEERQTPSGKQVDMARGLLSEPQGKRLPPWVFPVSLLVVALAAVLITFTFMGGFKDKAPAVTREERKPAAVSSSPVPPLTPPVAVQSAMPLVVAGPARQPPARLAKAASTTAAVSGIKAGPTAARDIPVQAQEPHAIPVVVPVAPVLPSAAVPVSPQFTVSGIAWQKDSASRYAMVNGTPVSKGGQVGSATVVDILPDRVRLALEGKTVEVFLEDNQAR